MGALGGENIQAGKDGDWRGALVGRMGPGREGVSAWVGRHRLGKEPGGGRGLNAENDIGQA